MGGMGKILKHAKKMQEKMEKLQDDLANSIIEVETAGGAIKIEILGSVRLHSIKIDRDIIDKDDAEGLEDLILTSVNQAIDEAKKFSEEKNTEITGDIPLPKGMMF